MKRTFTLVVERDPESQWLVGEVVELPECYSQGPDLPSLESNIREAIAAYLKTSQPREPRPEFAGSWRIDEVPVGPRGGDEAGSAAPDPPTRGQFMQ